MLPGGAGEFLMKNHKIALMTGKRGGWDAMLPLVYYLDGDIDIELDVLVTDQHLSHDFGYTYDDIRKGCKNSIPILSRQRGDSIRSRSDAGAEMFKGFAAYLENRKPDLALVYGDRLEALMWATACRMFNIPVGHMQSGDSTGGVDDTFRRCIEQIASLHFCSLEEHKEALLARCHHSNIASVWVVGDQHIDRITAGDIASVEELEGYRFDLEGLVLVLYHPDTLSRANTQDEIRAISEALRKAGGKNIVQIMGCSDQFYRDADKLDVVCKSFMNLPSRVFLGLLRVAKYIIGNSSCGIIEAAYLGTPAIDIGDRQKGRKHGPSVLHPNTEYNIFRCIKATEFWRPTPTGIYGNGTANAQIYRHIKEWLKT